MGHAHRAARWTRAALRPRLVNEVASPEELDACVHAGRRRAALRAAVGPCDQEAATKSATLALPARSPRTTSGSSGGCTVRTRRGPRPPLPRSGEPRWQGRWSRGARAGWARPGRRESSRLIHQPVVLCATVANRVQREAVEAAPNSRRCRCRTGTTVNPCRSRVARVPDRVVDQHRLGSTESTLRSMNRLARIRSSSLVPGEIVGLRRGPAR